MIIKIKKDQLSWYIVDNVTNLSTQGSPVYITDEDMLRQLIAMQDGLRVTKIFSRDIRTVSKDKPLPVCSISYTHQEQRNLVVFDTIAYITNDQSKTIERVVADEQYLP